MKIKYISISIAVVAAVSLGAFFGQNVNSKENHVKVALTPHSDREEKEHDTHDHDEHDNENLKNLEEHTKHDEHVEEEGEEGHGEEVVLTPHSDREEKRHDTHDHDEHDNENLKNPEEHTEHDEHVEEEGEEGHGEEVVLTPHSDREEKGHDTHDHDEHDNENLKNPEEHTEHDDHAEEGGEEGHGEEVVRLSKTELREFGITLKTAKSGYLNQYKELPGEIILNSDRIAHVVPRVEGIVREVRATVGDKVKTGQLLAVLDSRELADAKASYLAAIEREKLVRANFKREERLWEKKVTSEQEYLDARQALAEARIAKNSTEQQLHALGFTDDELKSLPEHPDGTYTRFEVRAPLGGTIIEKHMTFGENINAEADVFTIADLSTVWVNMNIYQKDLVSIRKGQTVEIEIGHGIPSVEGKIAWVSPQLDERTRTAKARIELPNPDGSLRPGLFVNAKVAVGSASVGLVVPNSALQTFEGKTVIFVQTDEGFEPKSVKLGRQNKTTVEVLSGLVSGQIYVAEGSFTLKAQLSKGAFGDGHNH